MPAEPQQEPDIPGIAVRLGQALDAVHVDYALGGAIALAFAGEPRATVDVDVTLFLPASNPDDCLAVLDQIGCSYERDEAVQFLTEHGYCRTMRDGVRVDVFLPTIPFYEAARQRRVQVLLRGHDVQVWSPEVLAVFKMMFFRRKDLADVERIIHIQGQLDRVWVRGQLVEIFGARDPRIPAWDELVAEVGESGRGTRDDPSATRLESP
jgi:hypothetical protein